MNENHEATILIALREEDDDGLRCEVSLDGAFSPHMAGVAVAHLQGALQNAMGLPEALMDVLIKAAKASKMEMQQRKQKPSNPRDKLYELLEALHEHKENASDERQA